MDMAIKSCIEGNFTPGFATDLAAGEYRGANRIRKASSIIGKLTLHNPLFPFIREHKQEYRAAVKYKGDRAIIFSALINATYGFGYDATVILGKFFHVQEEISSRLIVKQMASIYASNRSLTNGIYSILPMYIEAGLIKRPKAGIYIKNEYDIATGFARELYTKSFFIHNPMLENSGYDYMEYPYFEFTK